MSRSFWWVFLICLGCVWGAATLVLFFVEKSFEATLVCFVLAIGSAVVGAFTVTYWRDRRVKKRHFFFGVFLVAVLCAAPFIAVLDPFD